MNKKITKSIFVFFIFILPFSSHAQYKWELGSILGVSSYQGDFVEKAPPIFKEAKFAFGVLARYNLSYDFALRGGITVGKITGNDLNAEAEGRRKRGGSFSNILKEFSVVMEWEPFGQKRYLSSAGFKRIVSPYVFGGLGFVAMDPKVRFKDPASVGLEERVKQDANADYFNTRVVIPFGFGLKMDLAEYWSMSFEVGMRYAFTDYLDGLSIAGNPENNDWYSYSGVTVFHRLKNTRTSFNMKSKIKTKK